MERPRNRLDSRSRFLPRQSQVRPSETLRTSLYQRARASGSEGQCTRADRPAASESQKTDVVDRPAPVRASSPAAPSAPAPPAAESAAVSSAATVVSSSPVVESESNFPAATSDAGAAKNGVADPTTRDEAVRRAAVVQKPGPHDAEPPHKVPHTSKVSQPSGEAPRKGSVGLPKSDQPTAGSGAPRSAKALGQQVVEASAAEIDPPARQPARTSPVRMRRRPRRDADR